jgi:Ser/Thr protein kinase RdoA (MazF antagonist)
MMDRLTEYLRASGFTEWRLLSLSRGPNITLCVFRPGQSWPALVAKLTTPGAKVDIARFEAEALRQLEAAPPSLGVPQLVYEAAADGFYLAVETGARGRPLRDWVPPDDQKELPGQLRVAEYWLAELQRTIPCRGTIGESTAHFVEAARRALADPSPGERELLGQALARGATFASLPAVAVHGDFWTGNILSHRGQLSVIDWNNFHYGSTVEDLLNFASGITFRYKETPAASADTLWEAYFGDTPLVRWTEQAVARALARAGLGPEATTAAFLGFLATRLAMIEFGTHPAWRVFAARYAAAGLPPPFSAV